MRTSVSLLLIAIVCSSMLLQAKVEHPKTKAEYDALVKKAADENKHLAIKFSTTSCPHCIKIKSVFNDLDRDGSLDNVMFIEVNCDKKSDKGVIIDEFKELKKEYKVTGYPATFIIDAKTGAMHEIHGDNEKGIISKVKAVSKGTAKAPVAQPAPVKMAPKPTAKKMAPAKQEAAPTKKTKKSAKKSKKVVVDADMQ